MTFPFQTLYNQTETKTLPNDVTTSIAFSAQVGNLSSGSHGYYAPRSSRTEEFHVGTLFHISNTSIGQNPSYSVATANGGVGTLDAAYETLVPIGQIAATVRFTGNLFPSGHSAQARFVGMGGSLDCRGEGNSFTVTGYTVDEDSQVRPIIPPFVLPNNVNTVYSWNTSPATRIPFAAACACGGGSSGTNNGGGAFLVVDWWFRVNP